MCDTFVALPDTTANGDIIFGKNSDRPRNEIQDVVTFPATENAPNTTVQCTYLQIPQAKHTYAVILSKPRWMWGAEMGANEHGVVIGNEAVWTTQPYEDSGLLGMDLLRLGLERGATALKALEEIVRLLDLYGQGGNCAEHYPMNYHNSFILTDQNEAWVLETAGIYWVAEKRTFGTRSISNNLSINGIGDLRRPDLLRDLSGEDNQSHESGFDFARYFTPGQYEEALSPYSREGRVRQLCQLNEGKFTTETAEAILRDHEGSICLHGNYETRGSQISTLSKNNCQHWFIEGPFPCQEKYQLKKVLT